MKFVKIIVSILFLLFIVLVLSYCITFIVLSFINKYYRSINFDNITLILALIIGAVFSILAFLFLRNSYKILIKDVINHYATEVVIYFYQPITKIIIFVEFLVGVFFGGYILPFFFFNIHKIKMVTSETLFIYSILGSFAFIFSLFLGTYSIFLTNKRIIGLFLGDILKKTNLLLSEIKDIKICKKNVILISKNNLVFPLTCYPYNVRCLEKISYLLNKNIM